MSEVAKNAKKRNYYKPQAQQELRFIDTLQGIFLTSGVNDNFKISKSAFFMLRRHTNALPELVPKQKPTEDGDIRLADENVVAQDQKALDIDGFDLMDGEDPGVPVPQEDVHKIQESEGPATEQQEKQQELRFSKLLPGAKGCMFVNIPRTSESIQAIYADLMKAKQAGTNFENVAHFWPVQFTCKAERDDLAAVFKKQVERGLILADDLQNRVWEIKVRNNGGLKDETVAEWLEALGLQRKVIHWSEEKNVGLKRLFVNICRCNLMLGFN